MKWTFNISYFIDLISFRIFDSFFIIFFSLQWIYIKKIIYEWYAVMAMNFLNCIITSFTASWWSLHPSSLVIVMPTISSKDLSPSVLYLLKLKLRAVSKVLWIRSSPRQRYRRWFERILRLNPSNILILLLNNIKYLLFIC